MLERHALIKARAYNRKQRDGVLAVVELPWPWDEHESDSDAYALATALFQCDQGIPATGKLCPCTLEAIRDVDRLSSDYLTPLESVLSAPARKGCSNRVIVDGCTVDVPRSFGVSVSNYRDDGEVHFRHRRRSRKLSHLVLHESMTDDVPTATERLLSRGCGMHLTVDRDGHVSCHGDLVRDVMVHANQLNEFSVGLMLVNPYCLEYSGLPEKPEAIAGKWWTWAPPGGCGRYVVPTRKQMDTVLKVVPWLCSTLGIPESFPTAHLSGTIPAVRWPESGIVAHRDCTAHVDGRYVLEFLRRTTTP